MSAKKIVSISTARRKVMGTILVDGVEHEVLQMTFGMNQQMQHPETADGLDVVRKALSVVCPSLSPETVDAMGLDDGQAIIAFAGAGVELVEKMFPNVVGNQT